jgi:hypothetical protein
MKRKALFSTILGVIAEGAIVEVIGEGLGTAKFTLDQPSQLCLLNTQNDTTCSDQEFEL